MSDEIVVRSFASHADYQACVELQYGTWGREFKDAVPASVLQIGQKVGGVSAGAFDATGKLAGFVFGITGVEHGRIVHWSDMLAVRPEFRNQGLGRKLKEFQRIEVARVGGSVIYWTYDPLVARNAHLNFNVFGVRVVKYVRNMYGENTGSDLHRGIGTDRLIVAWDVDDSALAKRRHDIAQAGTRTGNATIEVPLDISAIQAADTRAATKWRTGTRVAFEERFAAGYRVDGFTIDEKRQLGIYLLAKP